MRALWLCALLGVACRETTGVELVLSYPTAVRRVEVRAMLDSGQAVFPATTKELPAEVPEDPTLLILLGEELAGQQLAIALSGLDERGAAVASASVAATVELGRIVRHEVSLVPRAPRCGDGRLDDGEDCDDGNTRTGDGCGATCRREAADAGPPADARVAADADVDAGAPADARPSPDANTAADVDAGVADQGVADQDVADQGVADQGVADQGVATRCGDGIIDPGERCDDGNTARFDGCDHECRVELDHACWRAPSLCQRVADIAYVDRAACSPAGDGSAGAPLCTIAAGLGTGRADVVIRPGRYPEALDIARQVRLSGDPAAHVDGGAARTLRVTTAQVTIVGLTFTSTVEAVKVESNAVASLDAVTIGPSGGVGLDLASGARLFLVRSRVVGNVGGGLKLNSDGGYRVERVIFTRNGNGASPFGAVEIRRAPSGAVFAYNTAFDNTSRGRANENTAVRCGLAAELVGSILWNATIDMATPVSTLCVVSHSDVGPGATLGGTNIAADPLLTADGHLGAGSPCIDRIDPSAVQPPPPELDIDRDRIDALADIGADERRP